MAEPREHLPKLAALDAYLRGALSSRAREQLERHLRGCDVCREALAGARRFAEVAAELHAAPIPELDWSRMELPLWREGTRLRRRQHWRQLGGALLLAAAAAAAALVMNQRALPPAPLPVRSEPTLAVTKEPAFVPARVMALAGTVVAIDADGRRIALDLDVQPREGWTLATAPEGELHLALENTASLIVPGGSKVGLRRLREDAVELELLAGQVVNHVEKRAPDQRYEVLAASRRVAVRGTRFAIELIPEGLAVQVDEGAVVVLSEDGHAIAELRAPMRWSSSNGNSVRARALRRPLESGAGVATWPTLELPSWPHVELWELRDAELSGRSELRMRAPAGDLDVGALLDDGRRLEARMHLDPLGGRFDPRTLRGGANRSSPASSATPIDPARISSVIREGQVGLQRCYERTLRDQQSALSGSVRARLRLTLDGRGRVLQVEWLPAGQPGKVPALLSDCVERVAKSWSFPAPGGSGVTFEAPISFRPAQ